MKTVKKKKLTFDEMIDLNCSFLKEQSEEERAEAAMELCFQIINCGSVNYLEAIGLMEELKFTYRERYIEVQKEISQEDPNI